MFTELFRNVWTTFVTVTGGLADGIKESFRSLIYKVNIETAGDESGHLDFIVVESSVSPLATFLFAVGGLGLAIGLIYAIFRLIRGVAGR